MFKIFTPVSKTVTGSDLLRDPKKAKLEWTIHNFSFHKDQSEPMYSLELGLDNIQWRLQLKPKVVGQLLEKVGFHENHTHVDSQFRFTDNDGTKLSVQAKLRYFSWEISWKKYVRFVSGSRIWTYKLNKLFASITATREFEQMLRTSNFLGNRRSMV